MWKKNKYLVKNLRIRYAFCVHIYKIWLNIANTHKNKTIYIKVYFIISKGKVCKDANYILFMIVIAYVDFIRQSVMLARLEKIVLRIAVWLVEIPGYVTKSRAAVTEAV